MTSICGLEYFIVTCGIHTFTLDAFWLGFKIHATHLYYVFNPKNMYTFCIWETIICTDCTCLPWFGYIFVWFLFFSNGCCPVMLLSLFMGISNVFLTHMLPSLGILNVYFSLYTYIQYALWTLSKINDMRIIQNKVFHLKKSFKMR